jgi:hypothetical protein
MPIMLRLLFWNLHAKLRLIRPLADAIRERSVDLVVTAESPLPCEELRESLSEASGREFDAHFGIVHTRTFVFSAKPIQVEKPIAESKYLAIYPVRSHGKDILLAVIHGVSRLEEELAALNEEACIAAALLRRTEELRRHRRTVLVGDFNLDPFDEGMAKARGFFGVMSRADARRESRRVKFNDYPIFYNPMWSRLGDLSPGPPGTFYRRKSAHLEYYWHTYDQVLIRPELLSCFDPAHFEVLDRAGELQLLRDGVPDGRLSDHLPVLVGLDLTKVEGG